MMGHWLKWTPFFVSLLTMLHYGNIMLGLNLLLVDCSKMSLVTNIACCFIKSISSGIDRICIILFILEGLIISFTDLLEFLWPHLNSYLLCLKQSWICIVDWINWASRIVCLSTHVLLVNKFAWRVRTCYKSRCHLMLRHTLTIIVVYLRHRF